MAILYILFTDRFLEKTSQGWISRGYARKKGKTTKRLQDCCIPKALYSLLLSWTYEKR